MEINNEQKKKDMARPSFLYVGCTSNERGERDCGKEISRGMSRVEEEGTSLEREGKLLLGRSKIMRRC